MTDPVFRRSHQEISLAAVADAARCALPADADPTMPIAALASLANARRGDVAMAAGASAIEDLRATRAGACLVTLADLHEVPTGTVALVSDDPGRAFARIAALIAPESLRPRRWHAGDLVHPAALIHNEARLEPGVAIGPGTIVGPGAEIGAGTTIGAACVIDADVRVGRACAIDAHVTMSHALLGDRVVVHAGARIGVLEAGVPGLGRAILQSDVTIGANAIVMRGGMGDTVVGEGAAIAAMVVVTPDTIVERHVRLAGR